MTSSCGMWDAAWQTSYAFICCDFRQTTKFKENFCHIELEKRIKSYNHFEQMMAALQVMPCVRVSIRFQLEVRTTKQVQKETSSALSGSSKSRCVINHRPTIGQQSAEEKSLLVICGRRPLRQKSYPKHFDYILRVKFLAQKTKKNDFQCFVNERLCCSQNKVWFVVCDLDHFK